jgi:hypothetical protein
MESFRIILSIGGPGQVSAYASPVSAYAGPVSAYARGGSPACMGPLREHILHAYYNILSLAY